eukprot:COSAG06_NODE_1364_length_9696_cov_14.104929_1_plen_34_part_10
MTYSQLLWHGMVCGLHQVAVSKNFKGESETIKGI